MLDIIFYLIYIITYNSYVIIGLCIQRYEIPEIRIGHAVFTIF